MKRKRKRHLLMKKTLKKQLRRVKSGEEMASFKLKSELRIGKRQMTLMGEICNSQWARYLGTDATCYMMSLSDKNVIKRL